jgi:transposase
MLDAEIQARILSLYFSDKKSVRAISILVGVDRKTVRRVIDRKQVALIKRLPQRISQLDDHHEKIKEMLHKDPSMAASTILHRLREYGFNGGVGILRNYVRKLKQKSPKVREAFLRLEFAPGECAQVDWGEFGDVFGDGVKMHCFVMVLCYSRMAYIVESPDIFSYKLIS